MSDLTNPTFDGSNQENNEPDAPPPRNIAVRLEPELPPETFKSKGGRPRGATLRASMEKEAKREALINDIATAWSEKVESEVEKKKRMRKKRA